MGGIADYGLVEVTDLNLDVTLQVRHSAEIAEIAIAADPYFRALWQGQAVYIKPFANLIALPRT